MSLITQTSDPTLWAALSSCLDQNPNADFVQRGSTLYRVMQETTSEVAFLLKNNRDMIDSRSITGSRPASYNKLDGAN